VNTQKCFIATACATIIIANHWDIFVTVHLLCIVQYMLENVFLTKLHRRGMQSPQILV